MLKKITLSIVFVMCMVSITSAALLDPVTNFAKVTVSTGYDASATSIVLSSGGGALLPGTFSYNVIWWDVTNYPDPNDDPNVEIVRVTAKSGETLTVTRAQEGTSATTKNTSSATYLMILGITKKMIDDIDVFFQPLDTDLTAIAALANTDGNFMVGNGSAWVAESGATALASIGGIGAATTDTLTNKTIDANGTGNGISNIDVADLADGTDGQLVTWDAAGAPAVVAVGTATHVLTSNGAGAAPTFQSAAAGETNSLETTITGILDTEIFIGDGADSGAFVAMSGDVTMANTGATTIGTNTVALTTNTTGNYANGDAEAGAALTGDAAVDFFGVGVDAVTDTTTCTDLEGTALSITAGTLNVTEADPTVDTDDEIIAIINASPSTQIAHEAGGLESDVNAYSGLVAIAGGSTTEVNAKSELETQIADVADFAEADGDVYTGTHDFGGADDLEVPNSATPTVDTAGQVALDTTITDHQPYLKYYSGAEEMTVVALPTANLSATDDYLLKYDAASDDWQMEADVTGAGSGAFSDAGDPVVLNTVSKDVHVGDGAGTLAGKFEIGGDANQPQAVIEGHSTQTDDLLIIQQDDDTELFSVSPSPSIKLLEVADAPADTAGYGQIWINTATPNELYFTDDAGTDVQLGAGGGGAFNDASDPAVLNTTTKDVNIGTTHNNAAKLSIDGDANQVQLSVQGNATQTSLLAVFENSAGTDILSLSNAGELIITNAASEALTLQGWSEVGANVNSGQIEFGDGSRGRIYFDGSGGDLYFENLRTGAVGDIIFKTNGAATTAMTIDGTGTIDIPSSLTVGSLGDLSAGLNIDDADSAQLILTGWDSPNGANGNSGAIEFGDGNRASLHFDSTDGDLYIENKRDTASGNIIFLTRTLGTDVTGLEIEGTGDLVCGFDVEPDTDSTGNLGTVARTWADVNSVLINGADICLQNEWRLIEAEDYGYPAGICFDTNVEWRTPEVIGHDEVGYGDRVFPEGSAPVFAITNEFIEFKGVRITSKQWNKLAKILEEK